MNDVLFIGDSHIIHAFDRLDNTIYYLRDVTLNRFRKNNNDVKINFLQREPGKNFDTYILTDDGVSLIEFINSSDFKYIVFSIGEIDVRFHLGKQLARDENALIKINDVYKNFLTNITKKIIVMSLPPPGISDITEYTRDIETRKRITKELNKLRLEMCTTNNFYYYDFYTDYECNGILDNSKSDGQVHTGESFIPNNILKLQELLRQIPWKH